MNTLFIRADATTEIGTGHIMRCLALAQASHDQGGKVTFISHCESDALCQRLIEEEMDFITIEKSHPDPRDFECTMRVLHEFSKANIHNAIWLVIDGYNFDATYQKRIKETGYKLLWIDDYGHADHYYADLVLNQNISADESLYTHCEPDTRLLLGTRYALLRREFKQWQGWQREIPIVARKVLVTLGGGDPDNVTLKVVQALKQVNIAGLEAKIIVGPANPNLQALEREISSHPNFQLIKNALNMPEVMAWADLAVSAGGSTCWEMALLGLPNMIMYFADNQCPIAEKLHESGVALSMGWSHELTIEDITQNIEDVILSQECRKEFSTKSKDLVDGRGAQRICQEIQKDRQERKGNPVNEILGQGLIYLRKICPSDRYKIYRWRNSPDVAKYMYTDHMITEEEHNNWFDGALKDPDRKHWVIVYEKEEIGLVSIYHIDTANKRCCYSSYIVSENLRGRGIGALVEYYILRYFFEDLEFNKICTEVFSFNTAGINIHKSLGFQEEGFYRQHRFKNGQFVDVVALAMLKSEWNEKKKNIEKKLTGKGVL